MDHEGLNILKIVWSSGITVKLVLALLILASVLTWAIAFKKRKFLKELEESNDKFLKIYTNSSSLEEVISQISTVSFSSLREVFESGYTELVKIKTCISDKKINSLYVVLKGKNLERALQVGVSDVNLELEDKLSTLATMGAITPFIGLFGTVWGIIDSFTGLASGGATLDAVAPGIAEALVATAMGLFAAIPAVWFYNYFSNINIRLNMEMDAFGNEFLNYVDRISLDR